MSKYNRSIDNPGYQKCETCKGEGVREINQSRDGIEMDVLITCIDCDGRGEVWNEIPALEEDPERYD